ncbi:MAG TPA: magnesium/cobalt transporter CorA [Deltaproteobacteria bacterium]|nr:magnesium/cobalt transporter CorA [Deltaproteobacteria bacterium]
MASYVHPHSRKAGLPPGSFIHVGSRIAEQTTIDLFTYTRGAFRELTTTGADETLAQVDPASISWINVSGLSEIEAIGKIAAHFGLHPLTTEDILNTGQRPKIEDHGDYLFASVRMLYPDDGGERIIYEQVSIILGENYVLTFQEGGRDVFDPVRERIRTAKGRIRGSGPDYLAYSLLDAVVDQYYVVLEKIGEHVEETEDRLVTNTTPDILRTIHGIKNEMLFLRRIIWPLRDVVAFLARGDSQLIQSGTTLYFRDVYDHTIQAIDSTELYRDIVSSMLDTYLTSLSNRMNEVMKVLTVFATIFIPLTFVVGIYGMNFEYMPELRWRWGYPALWAFMGVMVASMVMYFRRKHWI